MTTENVCQPAGVTNRISSGSNSSVADNFKNFDSNSNDGVNFANFEKMNRENGIQNHAELQRHNSEMNFVKDRNEIYSACKSLGRTNSFDIELQHDVADLCENIREFQGLDFPDVKSPCKGDTHYQKDFERSFDEACGKSTKSFRSSNGDFHDDDDDDGHLDSFSSKDYNLGGCTTGDDEWDSDGRPTGERWPPLGAPNDDEDNQSLYSYSECSW